MNRLVIIGASCHGKVIADIAILNGYKDIVFLDDDENIRFCAGFPVVGRVADGIRMAGDKIVAIGNAVTRERIQRELDDVVTLIHPNAIISRRVQIGKGTVVMAGAVINSDAVIGDGCIINTGASLDHDCVIEDFAHVSFGAHIAGTVRVGKRAWIGAGAVVINNLNICGDCMVGAGAVVVRDITEQGTYIGVPAKEKNVSKHRITGGGYCSTVIMNVEHLLSTQHRRAA